MKGPTHRFIETNAIQMHVAEQGEGPLVLLCHGFPEIWYSWRDELPNRLVSRRDNNESTATKLQPLAHKA